MKRLQPTTIKRYSAKQLARHLDRLDSDKIRVDFQYGSIYLNGYFECNIHDYCKDSIVQCIHAAYKDLGI